MRLYVSVLLLVLIAFPYVLLPTIYTKQSSTVIDNGNDLELLEERILKALSKVSNDVDRIVRVEEVLTKLAKFIDVYKYVGIESLSKVGKAKSRATEKISLPSIDPLIFVLPKIVPIYKEKMRVFIKVSDSFYLEKIAERARKLGAKVLKTYREIDYVLVEIPVAKLKEFITELSKEHGVLALVADRIYKPLNIDSVYYIEAAKLRVLKDNAFPGINGSGVVVAVLDTGIDPNHPDFYFPNGSSKIVGWKDFVYGNETPYDDDGHGTHVAATIAGTGLAGLYTHSGTHVLHIGARWRPAGLIYSTAYPTNATLIFNLTALGAGKEVKLTFWSLTSFSTAFYEWWGLPISSALVYVSSDGENWTLLGDLSKLGNPVEPVWENFTFSTIANGSLLYVRYSYSPVVGVLDRGWFLDDIALVNVSNGVVLINITFEDVELPYQHHFLGGCYSLSKGVTICLDPGWHVVDGRFEGVAPGAKLLIGKVCTWWGCPTSAIMKGIEWAAENGAHIISMSLGGPAYEYDPLAELVDYVVDHYGVVVVIAAGNEGDQGLYTVASPGIAHKAITVGAAQKPGLGYGIDVAFFSSRGPSPVDYVTKPDVVAPGVAIVSAKPTYSEEVNYQWDQDAFYTTMSGTSMATPHVSGAVALIKQVHPDWTPEMIKNALISTATFLGYRWSVYSSLGPLPATVYDQGGGLINVTAAITTPAIPIPASLSFAIVPVNTSKELNSTIILLKPNATVSISRYFFRYIRYEPLEHRWGVDEIAVSFEDHSDWLNVSLEQVNESAYLLRAKLAIPPNAPMGLYDGYIELDVDGRKIHLVLTALVPGIRIRGYVVDKDDNAVPGATVCITNASNGYLTRYGTVFENMSCTQTDNDGYYEIAIYTEKLEAFFVEVMPSKEYYHHRSLAMEARPEVWMEYNATLVPRTKLDPDKRVLFVIDDALSSGPENVFGSDYIDRDVPKIVDGYLGIRTFVWSTEKYGLVTADLLNDFNATVWLSGAVWFPMVLPQFYDVLWYLYVRDYLVTSGSMLVEGEDVGWFYCEFVPDLCDYYRYMFHVNYIGDNAGTDTIVKILANYITVWMNDTIKLEKKPPYPDMVEPIQSIYVEGYNATALYVYSTDGSAIVLFDGYEQDLLGYPTRVRTIYIAFPVSLLPSKDKFILFRRAVPYLLGIELSEIVGGELEIPVDTHTDCVAMIFATSIVATTVLAIAIYRRRAYGT